MQYSFSLSETKSRVLCAPSPPPPRGSAGDKFHFLKIPHKWSSIFLLRNEKAKPYFTMQRKDTCFTQERSILSRDLWFMNAKSQRWIRQSLFEKRNEMLYMIHTERVSRIHNHHTYNTNTISITHTPLIPSPSHIHHQYNLHHTYTSNTISITLTQLIPSTITHTPLITGHHTYTTDTIYHHTYNTSTTTITHTPAMRSPSHIHHW